ncbi:MAG TPA: hypothetical protein VF698_08430 [Thermoanaerobaculia bacterium]
MRFIELVVEDMLSGGVAGDRFPQHGGHGDCRAVHLVVTGRNEKAA